MTGIIADLILLQVKNLNLAVSQSKKNIVNSINFGDSVYPQYISDGIVYVVVRLILEIRPD